MKSNISSIIIPASLYKVWESDGMNLTLIALIPPSSPVPLPNGIRGTLCSLQSFVTPDTCSTLSAKATTCGGAHLKINECTIGVGYLYGTNNKNLLDYNSII